MPTLSKILNDSDEIKIPTNAGDITIEYYPSRVTQKMASKLRAFGRMAGKEDASDEALQKALHDTYGLLLNLVKSWDLEDEVACGVCEECRYRLACEKSDTGMDKELAECTAKKMVPFPLEPERMDDLPVWLIGAIAEALVNPNRKAPQNGKKN